MKNITETSIKLIIVRKYQSNLGNIVDQERENKWIESENTDDELLMWREAHLCTRGNFQTDFVNLFNANSQFLYQNQAILNFNRDENDWEAAKNALTQNIIGAGDIDRIKDDRNSNQKRRVAVTCYSQEQDCTSQENIEDEFDIEAFIKEKEEMEKLPVDEEDILSKYFM